MFAITRNLCRAVGLALAASMQIAAAQTPIAARNVTRRSECPVEPHTIAINPDVVLCHAKFAPLPVMPPEINSDNPDHLEILREKADVLLQQLDRPEACGRTVKVRSREVCAILVYVLDEAFRQDKLPWTYIVKIYHTNQPAEDHLRDMVLSTVTSTNAEGVTYGPVGSKMEVWKLLADQRMIIRCVAGMTELARDTTSTSSITKAHPDKCRHDEQDARYHPALLIGRGEAKYVLNKKSIQRNFGPAP